MRLAVLSTIVLFFVAGLAPETAANDAADLQAVLQRVLEASTARQAAAKSFRISWYEQTRIPRGSRNQTGAPRRPGDEIPREDVMLKSEMTLLVDGGRAAYDCERRSWLPGQPSPEQHSERAAFDGHSLMTYSPIAGKRIPVGRITPRTTFVVLPGPLLRLVFRPVALEFFGFNANPLAVAQETGTIEGRPCTILWSSVHQGFMETRAEIWVDPERDYIPLKHVTAYSHADNKIEIDMSYRKTPEGTWVPTGWVTYDVYSNVRHERERATVTDFALHPKGDLEGPEPFFPIGTWVYDDVAQSQYVVAKGGGKRAIKRDEGPRDYAKIMAEPAPATHVKMSPLTMVVVGIVGVIALVLLVFRLWS